MSNFFYTDEQIKFIIDNRNIGLSFKKVTDAFNKKFEETKTVRALTRVFYKYKDFEFNTNEMISNIRTNHTTRKRNSKLLKENKALVDFITIQDDIQDEIKRMYAKNKNTIVKAKPKNHSSKKETVAVELLISDIHVGIKTKTTNTEITSERITKYCDTAIKELHNLNKSYNIEKIQILLNGDLIQGNFLHPDSSESCETTDAEQVADAIEILFFNLIAPISAQGIKVDILGMCGNHDRQSKDRPIVNPGRAYLTYTIYSSLKMMTNASRLYNVSWTIPDEEYACYEMFGKYYLVEHGHAPGIKPDAASLEKQLLKRSNQLGKILYGIRIGHFHEPMISGLGRHIVNGSTVSDDHYGSSLGYVSYPCQLINVYKDNGNTNYTCYSHSLIVNLKE